MLQHVHQQEDFHRPWFTGSYLTDEALEVLVKTSIYCLTMPNNKRPEGVSDLVIGIQVVAFKLEIPSRQTERCKLNYSVCV